MIRSVLLHEGKIREDVDPKDWAAAAGKPGAVLWIDVEAPKRKATRALADAFHFDAISMADTQSLSLLPKLDVFKDYAFLVTHALGYDEASGAVTRRELDMFLGKGYLVTVHQEKIPEVDKVFKEAVKSDAVLARGPDILAHVIVDRLIDLAYEMVQAYDDDIEEIETKIAAEQLDGLVDVQLAVRRALLLMRKSIGPQVDLLNRLARRETEFIGHDASVYFRDDYDRLRRVYDMVDTNRELIAAAMEAYRSMISLKINEAQLRTNAVIERLTFIATIFLPLTFIVGMYGMNFGPNQPEYGWWWFYPFLLVLMLTLALFMLFYFKAKGWLREAEAIERADFVLNPRQTLQKPAEAPAGAPSAGPEA